MPIFSQHASRASSLWWCIFGGPLDTDILTFALDHSQFSFFKLIIFLHPSFFLHSPYFEICYIVLSRYVCVYYLIICYLLRIPSLPMNKDTWLCLIWFILISKLQCLHQKRLRSSPSTTLLQTCLCYYYNFPKSL